MVRWLALLAVSGVVWGAPGAWAQKSAGAARATPVVVAPVKFVSDVAKGTFSALLEPARKALISPEEPGKVAVIERRQGDFVERGEVLVRLTNTTLELELTVLQAGVRAAEAQLAQEAVKLKRIEALFQKQLASAEQYEDAAAAHRVAEARLAQSKAQAARVRDQLALMTVRAPFAGQVVRAQLEVGQWVTPTTTLFEILNYDEFELLVGVPARHLQAVPATGQVEVRVGEVEKTLVGEIAAVTRHVDSASGNFTVRVLVSNPAGLSLSGLIARVVVPLGEVARKITVPRDAIIRRGGKTLVAVVREGVARLLTVTVQGGLGDDVIVGGARFNPRDQVVVRGNERLLPGTPVKIAGTQ